MANCKVKIVGVIGQTKSGSLVGIKVFGTAAGCDLVDITIICDGQARTFGSKVTDGAWSVIAPPGDPREHPCTCDSLIEVVVECISGGCVDKFSGTLVCQDVGDCPDVKADVDYIDPDSKCGVGGVRSVGATITVAPDPSKAVGLASVTIDGTNLCSPPPPALCHPATTTPYAMSFTLSLTPGTHWLKYSLTDGCGSSSTSINVPKCPGSEACPKVELQRVEPGDCRGGKRYAKVEVLVTPMGGSTDASLTHGGTMLDAGKGPQVAPFVLTGADTFSSSGDSVTVNVTAPPGCPPTSLTVNVDPCQGEPPPPPPGSGGGDDNGGSGGCIIGRIFVALLLAGALFMFLVGLCVPGAAPGAFIAAAALAAAGAIAFAIWWFLCGSKCGALLIMWQIAMIGAWVSAFLATCCPTALLMAIGLGVVAAAMFAGWITACKPSKCKVFSELLWVYVAAIGTIFAYLTKFVPCGLPTIPIITASIAAALAIAVAAACK